MFFGHFPIMSFRILILRGMLHLDARESRLGHCRDKVITTAQLRMGQGAYSAGVMNEFERIERRKYIQIHISGRAFPNIFFENLLAGSGEPLLEHVCAQLAPGDARAIRIRIEKIFPIYFQAAVLQSIDDFSHPLHPGRLVRFYLRYQTGRIRLNEMAEKVYAPTIMVASELYARNELHPQLFCFRTRTSQTRNRVVVRKRYDANPGAFRPLDELFRGIQAIRHIRMGMKLQDLFIG